MHRSKLSLFLASLVVGLMIVGPTIATPPNGHPNGKHGSDTTTTEECDGGTVTYAGPETMWPPNHKPRDLTVTAEAEDESDNVELATEGTHDEYADPEARTGEMNGSGNTDNDIEPFMDADMGTGVAQTAHAVLAERSGRGDGRTYTLLYEAQFGTGEPCLGSFEITVPHSQGASAENKKVHEPGDPDEG